ncbi:MAG: prepilin-type N-terminal cleavage/methylation domain-containing protein [Pseudomonadota bacterium]
MVIVHTARSSLAGRQVGFSLLEMLVAMTVLALTLAALYQAAGGASRNVRTDERYAYGVELARSLLAEYGRIPAGGLQRSGETPGGFQWQVVTRKLGTDRSALAGIALHEIEVTVRWPDGARTGEVALVSVAEGERSAP